MIQCLELDDMEHIRRWRNASLDTLRTPFPLTREQQEAWYRDEICNRNSRSRFWAIVDTNNLLVGYGGIENIQWENSIGEISLLIDPKRRGHGYGRDGALEIINEGFNRLGLRTIYAECYMSNPAVSFWRDIYSNFNGTEAILPNRKYCGGKYYDSAYFSASIDG
jgi:RimJ/RimL family protein N-acetyltransferase